MVSPADIHSECSISGVHKSSRARAGIIDNVSDIEGREEVERT